MNHSLPRATALAALLLSAPLSQAADPIRDALQRGLLAEEAQRDLASAADAYAEAVRLGDEERAFVATALFRLAEAQRRLGRTNEAAVHYRRLVRDFSDWTNLTAIARSREPEPDPLSLALVKLQKDQERALLELQTLRSRVAELDALRKHAAEALSGTSDAEASGALAAAHPTPELNRLRAEYHQSETRLATLRNTYGPQHPELLQEETVLKTLQNQLQKEVEGILQALDLRAASLRQDLERQERRVQSLALLQAQEKKDGLGPDSSAADGPDTPEDYLRQEIALAEQQVQQLETMNVRGVAGSDAVLKARRELLALKRQRAGLHKKDLLLESVPVSKQSEATPSEPARPAPDSGTNAVAVLGAVTRPGMIPISEGKSLDLVELIARCGDLTRLADRNRIRVYRGDQTLVIGLDQAMNQRFELQPGDRVEIRERVF